MHQAYIYSKTAKQNLILTLPLVSNHGKAYMPLSSVILETQMDVSNSSYYSDHEEIDAAEWTKVGSKGAKRKNLNKSTADNPPKRQIVDNPLATSTPMKDSSERDDNHGDNNDSNDDTNNTVENKTVIKIDENISKVENQKDTVELLRKLLEAKEDAINHKEVEKNYLRNRLFNMEKLVNEKEAYISRLEKTINDLYPTIMKPDREEQEQTSGHDQKPMSTSVEKREKEKATAASETRSKKKCKYEDKGKCRERSDCKFIHPRGTCKSFSANGVCKFGNKCTFRHPSGTCHQWENSRECPRGNLCKFRHPSEVPKKSFLGSHQTLHPYQEQKT